MAVHVAHPFCKHPPAATASSGRGNLLVLSAAHGKCYLDIVVGQGGELG